MFPTLQLGPLSIPTPGFVLLAGLWLALILVEKLNIYLSNRRLETETLYNLVLIGLISGLVGARLVYAARYLSAFVPNPMNLFSLNPGLLDPWGGWVVGTLAGWIYGNKKGLPFWPLLDALTPGLGVMGIALGLARLASGSSFGQPTNLPWGILLWGEKRHPTQVYEILASVTILIIVLALFRRAHHSGDESAGGMIFLSFLALFSASQLFIEGLRAESIFIAPLGFRAVQVAAWIVLALSLWGLGKRVVLKTASDPDQFDGPGVSP